MNFTLPEGCKVVEAITPQAGAAITGDYVSLKHCSMAYVVLEMAQASVTQSAITIEQATAVAGTSTKAISVTVPIWANEDCVASDTLVRQTAAVSFTTSAAQKHKIVIFQIDPATLDMANSFDCITVKTAASDATNITAAQYYLVTDYPQATPPAAITD